MFTFFFSSRRRHTRWNCDWSSDVCSSDLPGPPTPRSRLMPPRRATTGPVPVEAVRHTDKRVNIPTADAKDFVSPEDAAVERSEERRVGKEWRSRGSPYQ